MTQLPLTGLRTSFLSALRQLFTYRQSPVLKLIISLTTKMDISADMEKKIVMTGLVA